MGKFIISNPPQTDVKSMPGREKFDGLFQDDLVLEEMNKIVIF
jgi:hypothetical protein